MFTFPPMPEIEIVPSRSVPGVWAQAVEVAGAHKIQLTKKAMRLSKRLRKYVIVHEYAHTLMMTEGHGELWQDLMTMMLPDWRKRHHELRWLEEGVWVWPEDIYKDEL